jgi:hypothetical protein
MSRAHYSTLLYSFPTLPALIRDIIGYLVIVYFNIFNFIYPFIDRQNFILNTLIRVYIEGFNSNIDLVIILLVFILGELVIKGSYRNLIKVYKGYPSSRILLRLLGLILFNEVRKYIRFVLIEYNLENI